jgi:hypothetical protein
MSQTTVLPLWAAIFSTMWQVLVLIWAAVKFNSLVSVCRASNTSGQFNVVKNAMLLSMFSYAPLMAISICFVWISYAKNWEAGPVFVMLPALSILFFFLFLLATVNDITKKIDVNRRGRKRLPMQAPPQLVMTAAATANIVEPMMSTPRREHSAPPELPLQSPGGN